MPRIWLKRNEFSRFPRCHWRELYGGLVDSFGGGAARSALDSAREFRLRRVMKTL